jgi:hypothetical protein
MIYPVAVGNNGSVVYSYLDRGTAPRLAANECASGEPGKAGPGTGYAAQEDLKVELAYNGRPLHNTPTLSRDRRYLICPDQAPLTQGKAGPRGRTMILRLPPATRQRILEILDEPDGGPSMPK